MAELVKYPDNSYWQYFPELMTVELLRDVLSKRHTSTMEDLVKMDKEKLVSLYRRVVITAPKRKHKIRDEIRDVKDDLKRHQKEGLGYTIGFPKDVSTITSPSVSSRLKPPPETNNASKKLKLNSCEIGLDSVVINDRRKRSRNSSSSEELNWDDNMEAAHEFWYSDSLETNGHIEKKEKREKEKEMTPQHNDIPVDAPKRVSLKRNFSQPQATCSSSGCSSGNTVVRERTEEGRPEVKKQKKKITWP